MWKVTQGTSINVRGGVLVASRHFFMGGRFVHCVDKRLGTPRRGGVHISVLPSGTTLLYHVHDPQ